MPTTITEGLAELKTIAKRIEKKQAFIQQYLVRQTSMADPFVKEGGTPSAVAREQQSLRDLEERIVKIRSAIAHANASTTITCSGITRTIADWLSWRREVSEKRKAFVATLVAKINQVRQNAAQKGLAVVQNEAAAQNFGDVVVNVDEMALNKEVEALEEMLGTLDGLLSLKNATITIEV